MFVKIQNKGVCPIEGYTLLGASSSRDDQEKIGQFGSGNKLAILTCLRFGLEVWVCLGKKVHKFFTKEVQFQDKKVNQLFYSVDGIERATDTTMEWGVYDWDSVTMGLREFIANALDYSDKPSDVKIGWLSEPQIKKDHTTILLRVSDEKTREEIQIYLQEIKKHFLHFSSRGPQPGIIRKRHISGMQMWWKGCWAGKSKGIQSMFDYNVGGEVKIDECRKMNLWDIGDHLGRMLAEDNAACEDLFREWEYGHSAEIVENRLEAWQLPLDPNFLKWFQNYFGEMAVPIEREETQKDLVCRQLELRGYRWICIPKGWASRLKVLGAPDWTKILTETEIKGIEFIEAKKEWVEYFDRVWGLVELFEANCSKDKPTVKYYNQQIMESGTGMMGYVIKDHPTIHLREDSAMDPVVILEEIVHYCSGASDIPHGEDFQAYSMAFLAKALDLL